MSYEDLIQAVWKAVDDINQELPQDGQLIKDLETVLLGREGVLDSLAFVSFIVGVESRIEEDFQIAITIVDEKAMSQKNSPFQTLKTLIDYIFLNLGGKIDE